MHFGSDEVCPFKRKRAVARGGHDATLPVCVIDEHEARTRSHALKKGTDAQTHSRWINPQENMKFRSGGHRRCTF